MRLIIAALLLFVSTTAEPTRLRLLLRDEHGGGVAGASLLLRLADGQLLELRTDAQGLAVSAALPGAAAVLLAGHTADGHALLAESYPPGAGFRLALIAGATRDALLRLDGDRLVLDPDMIFAPDQSVVLPQAHDLAASLVPTSPPLAGAALPILPAEPAAADPAVASGGWLLLGLALAGALFAGMALLLGRWLRTRSQARGDA